MQLMDAIRLQNLSHHNNSDDASSIMKSDVGSGNDEVASVVESDFVRISSDLKRKVELSTLENFVPLCGMRTALVIRRKDTQFNAFFLLPSKRPHLFH